MTKEELHKSYQNPLGSRYASKEMSYFFSEENRIINWRKLWINLAASQKILGLAISQEQIEEMQENLENIDYMLIAEEEKRLRHDVMSNVHAFAKVCPKASKIIHLGATSCYVTDNTDLIIMKDALMLLKRKLLSLIALLENFCTTYASLPCLGYTHFQTAQLVTVGKRGCLWLQDLLMDLKNFDRFLRDLKFRGAKGTTGTQASYSSLFDGDVEKVFRLDELVAEAAGFSPDQLLPVTGQTYSRKWDHELLCILSSFAVSSHKIAVDLRLLAHLKEIEEPYEKNQIGSSAMAYKRNPMRSERICSLSRHLMTLAANASQTAANQWLERTLDDSANRRITISEAFLTADALIIILNNVFGGIIVNENVIKQHLENEIPFMVTERIIMAMVLDGKADRQECHEKIRQLSVLAHETVKGGGVNDLFERISSDPYFKPIHEKLNSFRDPQILIGCCQEQVERFIDKHVKVTLSSSTESLSMDSRELEFELTV